jgi:hypothetical protein
MLIMAKDGAGKAWVEIRNMEYRVPAEATAGGQH